jgi:peptidoglycan/LPS O-acetylase OafA/YrhL
MSVTSVWPYFALMFVFAAAARLLNHHWKFGDPGAGHKFNVPLESLRGLLAVSVFFHHAVITFYYLKTGVWGSSGSRFYELLGPAAVLMFFFLSGYLFWSKSMADGGIPNLGSFLSARLRRLLPMYYVSCLAVFLVALGSTGFRLNVAPAELGKELLLWLTVGLPSGFPNVNGYPETPYAVASVVWTLRYEIVFYLFLPFLQPFAKGHRVWAVLMASGAVWLIPVLKPSLATDSLVLFASHFAQFMGMGFGLGMLAAYFKPRIAPAYVAYFRLRAASFIPLGLLIALFSSPIESYTLGQALLLWIPFVFVAFGNDYFGLLSTRSMLYLGKISYSFYLAHGFVLFVFSQALNRFIRFDQLSGGAFWCFALVCGLVTLVLSSVLHQRVELPFMSKKKKVLRVSEHGTELCDSRRRSVSLLQLQTKPQPIQD